MISLPIHNMSGAEVGTYEFDPAELAKGINKQLLHDVVVMYESNKRQGTVQTKSRGMVSGSTKKLFRQKGTGNARAGSKRSPIRRGGGRAHASIPQDWSYRLPKKAVRLATRMAILSKFQDSQVRIVDDITVSEPKTKTINTMLQALKVDPAKTLIAVGEHNPVVWKSSRNIAGLRVSPACDLNAYDLLRQRMFVVTKSALDQIRNPSPKAQPESEATVTA